jgi:Anti-sigma-K factor rskA/Putative zinc-finger
VSEIHESTGSYALDALDRPELAEFEAHLATCETCRNEVAGFSETAAELTLLSLATPPPRLRANILDAIAKTPQLPAQDLGDPTGPPVSANGARLADLTQRTAWPSGPRRALPGSEVPEDPEPPVDEVALRRQRRRTRILGGLVAAMLVVAVGLGGVIYTLVQQRQTQLTQLTLEEQLYEAPDTTIVTVDLKGGGQASFIASKELNRALFIGTDLPDPGPGNGYQLWTMTGEEPKWVTATSVSRDNEITDPGRGAKVFFSGDIAGADFLCVNLEPLSNTTSKPTSPPLASAEI